MCMVFSRFRKCHSNPKGPNVFQVLKVVSENVFGSAWTSSARARTAELWEVRWERSLTVARPRRIGCSGVGECAPKVSASVKHP